MKRSLFFPIFLAAVFLFNSEEVSSKEKYRAGKLRRARNNEEFFSIDLLKCFYSGGNNGDYTKLDRILKTAQNITENISRKVNWCNKDVLKFLKCDAGLMESDDERQIAALENICRAALDMVDTEITEETGYITNRAKKDYSEEYENFINEFSDKVEGLNLEDIADNLWGVIFSKNEETGKYEYIQEIIDEVEDADVDVEDEEAIEGTYSSNIQYEALVFAKKILVEYSFFAKCYGNKQRKSGEIHKSSANLHFDSCFCGVSSTRMTLVDRRAYSEEMEERITNIL